MRLVACVLELLPTRDLQSLPELFMSAEMATAPDAAADWRLVSRVWFRVARAMITLNWAGRVSENAVQAVADILPVRHHTLFAMDS